MAALRVAVAGPNGTLGEVIVKHLAAAGFKVTLLSRDPSKSTKSFPTDVKWTQVNYDTVDSIVPALEGQDAVVDLINRGESDTSTRLIDAAIAAKVQHFIPSSFGLNQKDPFVRSIPTIRGKALMEDYLAERAAEGKIIYTAIQTSMFLDWSLRVVLLPPGGTTFPVFNGGERKSTMTRHDDIGKAIVNALVNREHERVKNGYLFIGSINASHAQILQFAREASPGRIWTMIDIDTEDGLAKAWEAYNEGERDAVSLRGFVLAAYGRGYGLFEKVDNDVLGIETLSEEGLKQIVANHLA